MTFSDPQKGDLDRKLSELMHESRHKLEAVVGRRNWSREHGRVVVEHFAAANEIHTEAMERAKLLLASFTQRTGRPAVEVVDWARPHLENLNRSLIGVIPRGGVPEEYQRQAQQYGAIFSQRLDSRLRDIEIGYETDAGFVPSTPDHPFKHSRKQRKRPRLLSRNFLLARSTRNLKTPNRSPPLAHDPLQG